MGLRVTMTSENETAIYAIPKKATAENHVFRKLRAVRVFWYPRDALLLYRFSVHELF